MAINLLILLSAILIVAVQWGRRYNIKLAGTILDAVTSAFAPQSRDLVTLAPGLAYGADYTVDGAFPSVKLVLTLLPRYTPLYLPFAWLAGRRDLLKLTFSGSAIPPGVGYIIRDMGTAFLPNQPDDEMVRTGIVENGVRYSLWAYNQYITESVRRLIPHVARIESFRELTIDSRHRTVTVFFVVRAESIERDLAAVRDVTDAILEESGG
jgi:hypothetical protein